MAPTKSKLWSFFSKKNQSDCQCKLCLKCIKYSGNTSNMAKHLKTNHPKEFSSLEKEKICASSSKSPTSRSPRAKISSPIPSTSASIKKEDIQNPTKPASSFSGGIKDCFQKISSLQEGGHKFAAITNALLYFICKDNRPFHMVCGEGFQSFLKEVVPGYKCPSVKTLKKLIDEKYEVLKAVHLRKFKDVQCLSVTCDIWTETMTMRSFLGVTVHYIEDTSLKCEILEVKELSERHTAIHVSQSLCDVLDKWHIPLTKVMAVVTDNGSNMVAAINQTEGLKKEKHIPCFAHTLNLVAEVATGHPAVATLISKVRDIVKWVKASVVVSDQIREKQRESGVQEGDLKKFILDVKTRWNSVFYMLERFLQLQEVVNPILLKTPKGPAVLTASETENIQQLLLLLQALEFMTKELSGEQYITISKIIPMLFCAHQQLDEMSIKADDEITKNCKFAILNEMSKRFGQIEFCLPIAFATLLDPRFKNIHFVNPLACAGAIGKLKKLLESELSEIEEIKETEQEPAKEENENYSSKFWRHHEDVAQKNKKIKTGNSSSTYRIEDELTLYLRNPLAPLKSNPFETWNDMKNVFPNLWTISKRYLCIVATSVPSERLFSKAGATVSKDRNRLLGKRLSKLLFLGSCSKSEWNVKSVPTKF